MENLEKEVVKKTNKYVYFSDGTHMSHSDFHHYKQTIRRQFAIQHQEEFANSLILQFTVIDKTTGKSQPASELLNSKLNQVLKESETDFENYRPTYHDYKRWYEQAKEKVDTLNKKLINIGRLLYKELLCLSILKNYQNDRGIKFIIQENENNEFRFCFDPYELQSNFHSSLDEMYRLSNFHTRNGGWMKVIGDKIILYRKSDDYGVFDNDIAKTACQKLFPEHEIFCHAGESWDILKSIYE